MDEAFRSTGIECNSTLFEKAIPVKITKSSFEDKHAELTIRIIMGLSKHHRSTKVLQVQITNELDPFFLYSLEVTEDDFQTLKVEQCILVDFSTFPHKFIELLEHCVEAGNKDSPRFLAVLQVRTGDSTFSVVETNQFKHLSHLSLCFRQGNDCTIKTYLAGRLAEYKCANTDLHEKLRRTLLSLEKELRDVNHLTSELSELKENNSQAISELKEKYMSEIAHEKDKATRECEELKKRLEKECLDMDMRLREQADTYQGRVAKLDKQVHLLMDSKCALEMKLAEVNTKLEAAEKSLDERQKECDRLRRQNCSLDSEKHESAKTLNRTMVQISALEQEVQDKNELLLNSTRQLEVHASNRSALEGSLKDAHAAADRAEEKALASTSEVNKCTQMIEKLQSELRSSKAKVKAKAQIVAQQESLLLEKQAAIDKDILENNLLRQEVAGLKTANESWITKVDETKRKLDESQELIKSNQQMIQWLNQQLTEAQLGRFGNGGVASRYNFKHTVGCSPGSDTFGRGVTNHTGTFLSGTSLVGTLPSHPFKSTIPLSSYLQSVHSRTMSPGNSLTSSLSGTNSKLLNFGRGLPGSPPLSSGTNGPLKTLHKCTTQKASSGVTFFSDGTPTRFLIDKDVGSSIKANQFSDVLERNDLCPILPPPQLSFAESKSIVTQETKMMKHNSSKLNTGNYVGDSNTKTQNASVLSS